jgi:glycosyltransferase involved in cell wall biosynthesis
MRRRHVVFLESYPHAPGGVHVTTEMLALGLPEHGFTAEVVAGSDGPVLDRYRAAGIAVTVLPAPGPLLRYGGAFDAREIGAAAAALVPWSWRLSRHLRARRAAVLVVVDQRGAVMGAGAAAAARIPWVWQVHATGSSSTIDRVFRRLARRCVVASAGAEAHLGGRGHARIPPALEVTPDPVRRPEAGAPPRIVAAGRLHPVKGYDVLIDAAARLAPDLPGLTIEIHGGPQTGHEEHAQQLRQAIAAHGLETTVHLLGHRARPWETWNGATLFVLPSREEAFGLSLLEAMACGLPVVATRTAGPSDIIEHGTTGLLVAPGDPDALAAALRQVVEDPARAQAMGRAARAAVLARHSAERYVADNAAVLETAVGGT